MTTDSRPRQVLLKTPKQIEEMRAPGRMVGETLAELREMTRPPAPAWPSSTATCSTSSSGSA